MDIEWVKPTRELLESIADDMRPEDMEEVWASNMHRPLQTLLIGCEMSDYSAVAMYDGEPLVVFGLVKQDMLTGIGTPWMLGTNRALKHKRQFYLKTPPVVHEMMTICPILCNMVHTKNTKSIEWLKWVGFTIEDPQPHGPFGELFHPFHIGR